MAFICVHIYFYTYSICVYMYCAHTYFSGVNPFWWYFCFFLFNFAFNRIQLESELKRTTGNYLSVCYNWIWSFDITSNTKATTMATSNPSNTSNDDGDNSNSVYKIHIQSNMSAFDFGFSSDQQQLFFTNFLFHFYRLQHRRSEGKLSGMQHARIVN